MGSHDNCFVSLTWKLGAYFLATWMGLIIEIVAISIECQNKQFQISSAQQAQIKFNEITIIVPGVWVWVSVDSTPTRMCSSCWLYHILWIFVTSPICLRCQSKITHANHTHTHTQQLVSMERFTIYELTVFDVMLSRKNVPHDET